MWSSFSRAVSKVTRGPRDTSRVPLTWHLMTWVSILKAKGGLRRSKSIKRDQNSTFFLISFLTFLIFTLNIHTHLHKTQHNIEPRHLLSLNLLQNNLYINKHLKNQPYCIPEQSRTQKQLQCTQVSRYGKNQSNKEVCTTDEGSQSAANKMDKFRQVT